MPRKCKDTEELYNGRCRVKCQPHQLRSPSSKLCIDKTRYETQQRLLARAERQRQFDIDAAQKKGEEEGEKKGKLAGIAEGKEERDNLQNSLYRRDERIRDLNADLENRERRINFINDRIKILEEEKENLDRKVSNLNASVGRRGFDINKLNDEISQKNKELQELRRAVSYTHLTLPTKA